MENKNLKKAKWDARKAALKNLIITTVSSTGTYANYSFLMKETRTPYLPLITMLKQIAIKDIEQGNPTTDSLVTKEGHLIPEAGHFTFREKAGYLLPSEDRSHYHDNMIKRWCVELRIDFDVMKNTSIYIARKRAKRSKHFSQRRSLPRKSVVAPKFALDALRSAKGTFSMRELLRHAS